MNMTRRLEHKVRRVWAVLCLAAKTFLRIDGDQWAGSFAFNAFFALFPLMILVVTLASTIMDRDRAGEAILVYIKSYIPISGEMQSYIFDTIASVVKARGPAGVVAFLILVWVVLQCFNTLICATNRAWGMAVHTWWRLPLKSLVLLGLTAGAALFGMTVTVMIRMSRSWLYTVSDFHPWVYAQARLFIPLVVLFLSLSLFYSLAPRRPTKFAHVWAAALCATVLLQIAESLFAIYLREFATLNAVYGAFGGIMALLLWIYLSGCIFIFGACLCAAQAEGRSAAEDADAAR